MPHRSTCSDPRQSDQASSHRVATHQVLGDMTGLRKYRITMDRSPHLNDELPLKLFHLRSDQTVCRMANRSAWTPADRLRQGSTTDLLHSDLMVSLVQL